MTGGPIVGGVLTLRSTGILGTNLYGEILNGQSVRQEGTQDVQKVRLPDRQTMVLKIVLDLIKVVRAVKSLERKSNLYSMRSTQILHWFITLGILIQMLQISVPGLLIARSIQYIQLYVPVRVPSSTNATCILYNIVYNNMYRYNQFDNINI